MKINFVLPFYPWRPVGGFRVVYEYANRLVDRGHEVSVYHPKKNRYIVPEATFKALLLRHGSYIRNSVMKPKVRWQHIDPRVNIVYVPELNPDYICDGDAVIATACQTAKYVWDYSPIKGSKFYLIQHYEIWAGPKEIVDETWLWPMHKIVIASWLYELGNQLGVPDQEMRHIPNGIDHVKYRLINSIKTRPKRVAMLYSPVDWKGAPDGVKALEITKANHPDLKAVLFGVCQRPKFLPRWIDYLQDPPQDRLVQDIYNGSSIYLCPSWMEGWCLPNAEAMACGCAVVSTDNGGVRDYAINGKSALLSPVRKPELLAENLVRLLDDDEYRIELAQGGNTDIKSFTWDRAADLLEIYLQEVLSSEIRGDQDIC